MEHLLPLIKETMDDGRSFFLPVRGHSMWPFLLDSKSTVELVPLDTPRTGQIYLFTAGDKVYLHRLKKIKDDDTLIFRGDALTRKETVPRTALVSTVKQIKRTKRWRSVKSLPYRTLVHLWSFLGPLRPRIRKLCFMMKRDRHGK